MKKLDLIDSQLLDLLQENAKLTHKELAHELKVSTKPIFDRIKKFEQSGVIRNYVAVLNEKKVGKKLMAYCSLSLNNLQIESVEHFHQKMLDFPEVIEMHQTAGNFDYVAKVLVEDIDAFQAFLTKSLHQMPNIKNIQTTFVTKTIKRRSPIRNIKETAD